MGLEDGQEGMLEQNGERGKRESTVGGEVPATPMMSMTPNLIVSKVV